MAPHGAGPEWRVSRLRSLRPGAGRASTRPWASWRGRRDRWVLDSHNSLSKVRARMYLTTQILQNPHQASRLAARPRLFARACTPERTNTARPLLGAGVALP